MLAMVVKCSRAEYVLAGITARTSDAMPLYIRALIDLSQQKAVDQSLPSIQRGQTLLIIRLVTCGPIKNVFYRRDPAASPVAAWDTPGGLRSGFGYLGTRLR